VRPIKVLVVVHFEEFRRLVCALLIPKIEFQAAEAADGLEAVRKAEELLPDLIVLDIKCFRFTSETEEKLERVATRKQKGATIFVVAPYHEAKSRHFLFCV